MGASEKYDAAWHGTESERCQAAVPTGAGDNDACGAAAVALAVDPEVGLYPVCEEHSTHRTATQPGRSSMNEQTITALAEAVAAHVRMVLATMSATLPTDAALSEESGTAAECERRVVRGLLHGGGLDAQAFDVVMARAFADEEEATR